jgi:hypothetical protein
MAKTMFADIPLNERLQLLRDNCASCETTTYLKDLAQEEVDVKNQQVSSNCIKVFELEEELKKIKSDYKDRMEPLKDQTRELCQQVKTGQEEVKGMLFYFPDHEAGMMNVYDEVGEFVSMRRLLPEEKQARLFIAHGRTGTDE